jgi:hypothetical protein
MGIGQASGVAAGLSALNKLQPRRLDVKELQDTLIEIGASVFRNGEAKKQEEEHAKKAVAGFLAKRKKLITPGYR